MSKSVNRSILTIAVAVFGTVISQPVLSTEQVASNETFVSRIYRENVAKVVLVNTYDKGNRLLSQGSGFILTPAGKVVTNQHVITGANTIQVKMPSGAFYLVSGITAVDCSADLALLDLSISGVELPFVELADSATVAVGDSVVAIGSPLSLEASVSEGIISGIRESSDGTQHYFQTTAPVSKGNSGGPLLDKSGRVIGVITFEYSEGENLNFAVTSDSVSRLLESVSESFLTVSAYSCQVDAEPESAHIRPESIAGTYTGVWQSNLGPSGVALMVVTTEGDKVEGKLSVFGSPLGYKGDDLIGKVTSFSGGIWTVSLKGKNSRMSATAVFKGGNLLGDYTFGYRLFGRDRGQWVLQRENH